jgi:hypothetical protein
MSALRLCCRSYRSEWPIFADSCDSLECGPAKCYPCCTYLRVSTDEQAENKNGLNAQEDAARADAA